MAGGSSWRSSATTERLAVARILGVKGLAGGLRIEPLTDWPERLAVGTPLWVEDEAAPRQILDVEWGGRQPVLRLEGIADRSAAGGLIGRYLEAPLQPLPAGSYYWHQLEGLAVTDEAGTPLGTLAEVFRVGENEVYRVVAEDAELLLPALRDVILRIDLDAGLMVVRYEPEEVA